MGDDSAGSGLELGWKRAGRCKGVGLLRSARRDRLSVQGCPAGPSLLAACLASAAKQSLLAEDGPTARALGWHPTAWAQACGSREAREPRPALPVGGALVRPEASRLAGLLTRYVARRGYAPKSVQLCRIRGAMWA